MPTSYRQIFYHIVFRTENSERTLPLENSEELYKMVINYIINQREHHKKMSFMEEYRVLLLEAGVQIDERYFP